LPEELEPRIELLLLLIERVISMLCHKQHAVHRQFAGAQCERVTDGLHNRKIVRRQSIADVRRVHLVYIK
jgi:hypothetical protein